MAHGLRKEHVFITVTVYVSHFYLAGVWDGSPSMAADRQELPKSSDHLIFFHGAVPVATRLPPLLDELPGNCLRAIKNANLTATIADLVDGVEVAMKRSANRIPARICRANQTVEVVRLYVGDCGTPDNPDTSAYRLKRSLESGSLLQAVRNKKPPACAGGSCSCSRVAAYRLAWRLAPPLGRCQGRCQGRHRWRQA